MDGIEPLEDEVEAPVDETDQELRNAMADGSDGAGLDTPETACESERRGLRDEMERFGDDGEQTKDAVHDDAGSEQTERSAAERRAEADAAAEAQRDEKLSEFASHRYAVEGEMKSGHLAEWHPQGGEGGEGELVLNDEDWDRLSAQEQNAVLAHEKVHMEADEPYTPYQELEAKKAAVDEWDRQRDMYEQETGEELKCTNRGLEKDMEVTRRSYDEFEQGKDILETEAGQRALEDFRDFYDNLDETERAEYLDQLRSDACIYDQEDLDRWLGR